MAQTNIATPIILQGPAYVVHNGVTTFVQGDVAVSLDTQTWNPNSAYGAMGERLKSRVAKITLAPVGMLTSANMNYYYASFLAPSVTSALGIGKSVLNSDLVIVSQSSLLSYTWKHAGITKAPPLHLGPGKTAFGSMEFTAIGSPTATPLTAAQIKISETTVASNDTGFDASHIVTDVYKASWGSTPYDVMGSIDGFGIEFGMATKNIEAGDVGVADVVLSSLSVGAQFAPSNLTETQIDTLLRIGGTTAAEILLPGQEIARGTAALPGTPIPLVLTGTQLGMTFTIPAIGCKDVGMTYQVGQHRFKSLKFVNSRRWATGLETPLFAHTVA